MRQIELPTFKLLHLFLVVQFETIHSRSLKKTVNTIVGCRGCLVTSFRQHPPNTSVSDDTYVGWIGPNQTIAARSNTWPHISDDDGNPSHVNDTMPYILHCETAVNIDQVEIPSRRVSARWQVTFQITIAWKDIRRNRGQVTAWSLALGKSDHQNFQG